MVCVMANEFYAPGAQRAEKVNELFAAIARRYDLINDLQSLGLHRRWKRRVATLAAPHSGPSVLDLCCGTGDIAFALAARGANVTGVDFSEPMLAVARERAERSVVTGPSSEVTRPGAALRTDRVRVQFLKGDAMRLDFSDAMFDAVTSGYGLRNLSSWESGLHEMIRLLKPGGRIVVLEFGKPMNPLWRGAYFSYLKLVVPVLGLLFCGSASAYAYILESLKVYPGQRGVAAKMSALGLQNIRVEDFLWGAMAINYAEKPA